MEKKYRVAVGDRIFGEYHNKTLAVEASQNLSTIYSDKECRVVYKNWNVMRGYPVYVNGEEK